MHRIKLFKIVACIGALAVPIVLSAQRPITHTKNTTTSANVSLSTSTDPEITTPVNRRIPYATRSIERGSVLRATDIRWVDTSVVDTKISRVEVAAGWIARRAIRANELLQPPGVTPPDAVLTGSDVHARYRNDGITLTLSATAIGRGALGDTIYVRTQNRKRFRAIVVDSTTVDIVP